MTLAITKDVIILDASCIITLYATDYMEAILQSLRQSITVTAYVFDKEALWIKETIRGQIEKRRIDLQPLVEQNILTLVKINGDVESNLHVLLSSQIRDEGESRTGAIAINRNWAVALDDRKARRIISGTSNNIELVYSMQLVKHWADAARVDASTLQFALESIRTRATYLPRKANPYYQWWVDNGGPTR